MGGPLHSFSVILTITGKTPMRFFHPLCSYIKMFFCTSPFVPFGVTLKINSRLQSVYLWTFSCSTGINSHCSAVICSDVLLVFRAKDAKWHKDPCLSLQSDGSWHKFKVWCEFMDLLVSLNIHPAHSLGSQWMLVWSEFKCQANLNLISSKTGLPFF